MLKINTNIQNSFANKNVYQPIHRGDSGINKNISTNDSFEIKDKKIVRRKVLFLAFVLSASAAVFDLIRFDGRHMKNIVKKAKQLIKGEKPAEKPIPKEESKPFVKDEKPKEINLSDAGIKNQNIDEAAKEILPVSTSSDWKDIIRKNRVLDCTFVEDGNTFKSKNGQIVSCINSNGEEWIEHFNNPEHGTAGDYVNKIKQHFDGIFCKNKDCLPLVKELWIEGSKTPINGETLKAYIADSNMPYERIINVKNELVFEVFKVGGEVEIRDALGKKLERNGR